MARMKSCSPFVYLFLLHLKISTVLSTGTSSSTIQIDELAQTVQTEICEKLNPLFDKSIDQMSVVLLALQSKLTNLDLGPEKQRNEKKETTKKRKQVLGQKDKMLLKIGELHTLISNWQVEVRRGRGMGNNFISMWKMLNELKMELAPLADLTNGLYSANPTKASPKKGNKKGF